ncbi:MAG: radical SAM family heme chaperone HemW [Gammaproteobacteria bacterium]|jgi:oxygen-independent coproporphyrinogen-3 oxidase
MFNFTTTPPLTLYLHIPWCVRKCPYCDFNSHEVRDGIPERDYVSALLADLEQELPAVWGRPVDSVFFGGGTPSLFSPEGIGRLVGELRARLVLQPGAEITLEANPGSVDRVRFEGFRAAGINRLSIGVQSFQTGLLERIGRIHDRREAIRAAEAAHAAGFDNFNLDLMYGLPGQTEAQALADLRIAVDLEPAHVSWYELTIEPNTRFYRHPPPLPDDALLWTMQKTGGALLARRGYARYEVSAHARTGRECRHNLNYWRFGDYLGIGAGAHGKLTDTAHQCIRRSAKLRHPRDYLAARGTGVYHSAQQTLAAQDVVLEFLMNALRLERGFRADEYVARTGLPLASLEPGLGRALDTGLLVSTDDRWCTSEQGQRYLNDLLQYWIPEQDSDARTG